MSPRLKREHCSLSLKRIHRSLSFVKLCFELLKAPACFELLKAPALYFRRQEPQRRLRGLWLRFPNSIERQTAHPAGFPKGHGQLSRSASAYPEVCPVLQNAARYTITRKAQSTNMACYKSSFYSYGLFGLLDEWITHGFRETPEQMNEIVMAL